MLIAALDPWRARALAWWDDRNRREQRLIAGLGAVLLIVLAIVGIVRPLQAARAAALADIRTYDMLALRLRAAGPALASQTKARRGAASTIVTDSAAAAGLSVQRIEPEGGQLRVVLGDAPFDAVARWVADLEATSSLRVGEARIERRTAPGIVAAQVLLIG